jgi:hypothetical protein
LPIWVNAPCSEAAANTVIAVVLPVALAAAEDAALAAEDPAPAAWDVAELVGLALDPQAARAPAARPAAVMLEMTVNRRNATSAVAASHVSTTHRD